jgi:hypothetical protein
MIHVLTRGRKPLRCGGAVVTSRPVRTSNMRAETEKLVEDIKRSIGLLRRHL